jgi:hypothetical protein
MTLEDYFSTGPSFERLAGGATLLRPKEDDIHWWVMADPEGNEFCAFE